MTDAQHVFLMGLMIGFLVGQATGVIVSKWPWR